MAGPVRASLWGWTGPARVLLAVSAVLMACGLLVSSWRQRGVATPLPTLVLDPNTVPAEVLPALPRLGPTLAGRVAAARAERPFLDLTDLDGRVRGIGPSTIRALSPYVHIEPPRTSVAPSAGAVNTGGERISP
jgi:hypothetical protein